MTNQSNAMTRDEAFNILKENMKTIAEAAKAAKESADTRKGVCETAGAVILTTVRTLLTESLDSGAGPWLAKECAAHAKAMFPDQSATIRKVVSRAFWFIQNGGRMEVINGERHYGMQHEKAGLITSSSLNGLETAYRRADQKYKQSADAAFAEALAKGAKEAWKRDYYLTLSLAEQEAADKNPAILEKAYHAKVTAAQEEARDAAKQAAYEAAKRLVAEVEAGNKAKKA